MTGGSGERLCCDVRLSIFSAVEEDIALRGPRDFGFAAWVTKTAKATGPGEQAAQPGFAFPACTTREFFGVSIRPFNESVMYCINRSTALGADSRLSQADRASGTE